jgi:hypothetical protein
MKELREFIVMKDISYFIDQAKGSYQSEFNEDWADVIIERGNNLTTVVTEGGSRVKIYWDDNGEYESYFLTFGDIEVVS